MEKKLPKVLTISINAWREDATSHTQMDMFSCWEPEQLAQVYTRADLPNTKVCSRYFQISENSVLKSVFKRNVKTGKEVFNTSVVDDDLVGEEHSRYAKARKKRSFVMVLCREFVWLLGHWKTKELRQFVEDVNPDVLFVPIYPVVYMGWVQRYIQKITNKPMVCYLADDNYSYMTCKGPLSYLHRFWLRGQVKYLAKHCKEMFVIVEKEKEDTDALFGTDSVILTKGIDFTNLELVKRERNKPLKFVYTGNLIIGRDKTLATIADVLNELSREKGEVLATLDVYSPDTVDEETMKRLNTGCSKHRGFINRDEVKNIQKEADVVVFAEALEGKDKFAARLSFSTKITDYLAGGKCILAVGIEDIAPIDYFKKYDGAIIATNKIELRQQIERVVSEQNLIEKYEKKAFDCAKKNHEKKMMNQRFIDTIVRAATKE